MKTVRPMTSAYREPPPLRSRHGPGSRGGRPVGCGEAAQGAPDGGPRPDVGEAAAATISAKAPRFGVLPAEWLRANHHLMKADQCRLAIRRALIYGLAVHDERGAGQP